LPVCFWEMSAKRTAGNVDSARAILSIHRTKGLIQLLGSNERIRPRCIKETALSQQSSESSWIPVKKLLGSSSALFTISLSILSSSLKTSRTQRSSSSVKLSPIGLWSPYRCIPIKVGPIPRKVKGVTLSSSNSTRDILPSSGLGDCLGELHWEVGRSSSSRSTQQHQQLQILQLPHLVSVST
jgi:hypothetical protein